MILQLLVYMVVFRRNAAIGPIEGLSCTDYPSLSFDTSQENCEAGNQQNDGYEYLFNENRETDLAVCGKHLLCECCRGPEGLYCTAFPSSSGTNQERCEAGNDLNDGYEYLYNENRETDSAVCGKDFVCDCCRIRTKGLRCTGYPSPFGTIQERCEAGNDLNDGFEYLYNENRETDSAICGKDFGCDCCRRPEGLYCIASLPSSSGTNQERCEAGNDLNDGYEYLYNDNQETDSAVCGKDSPCDCCRRPEGTYYTDFPSSSGSSQEMCEAGNDLNDGYEYLYNENRGSDSAVCGKDASYWCCRRPEGTYCAASSSSSGTDQERCEAGNDITDGYEYLYNENQETDSAVCGKDLTCNCCRRPEGTYCTDYPTSSGTNQERCEAGFDLNDGYEYLYNENRETSSAVCGEDLTCNCCRRPEGTYYTGFPSSSGTNQERCEAGNDLNDGYEYLYNENRGTDSAVCGKDASYWCCRRRQGYKPGFSENELTPEIVNSDNGFEYVLGLQTLGTNQNEYIMYQSTFNSLFHSSNNHILLRHCLTCDSSHEYIYYKRLTCHDSVDLYSLTEEWRSLDTSGCGNILGTDFGLYSALNEALAGANPWQYCNYDSDEVGMFGDCGISGSTNDQWTSSSGGGNEAKFYIYRPEDLDVVTMPNVDKSANYLCETESWNIVDGAWDFDESICSLTNTALSSMVWFGSADGVTADTDFVKSVFQIKVTFKMNTAWGEAGVILRESSDVYYFICINPIESAVKFYNGNNIIMEANDVDIETAAVYEFKIVAIRSVYDVYLNNKLVLDDVEAPQLTASIGIMTLGALSTYYAIEYKASFDVTGSIGSLRLNDDGTIQQQSGDSDLSKLHCGANEDKPLWAGLLSIDDELIGELLGYEKHESVSKVLEYAQCSELVYTTVMSLGFALAGPANAIQTVNRVLRSLQQIPGVGDHVAAAADQLSEIILDVLNGITPDFTRWNWADYHENDGTIFNPFRTLQDVLADMLSEVICSGIVDGNIESIMGTLRDSVTVNDIRTSFNDKIYNLLTSDSTSMDDDTKIQLLTNDLYRQFSFVLTIGAQICFEKGVLGCITRMHSVSMNLNGESKIFEARSIYVEIPASAGMSISGFGHIDFLANYLDVINDELALTVGITLQIPGSEFIEKVIDILPDIPFIDGDTDFTLGVDFVHLNSDSAKQLITDLSRGGLSVILNMKLADDLEMNCNGFRMGIDVGLFHTVTASMSFSYEYRKENGIPQSWYWIDEIDLPNFFQIAKMMWSIASESGTKIFKSALNSMDVFVVDLVDDVGTSTENVVKGILDDFLEIVEDIANVGVDAINNIISGINTAIDLVGAGFSAVTNALNTAKNQCLKIDNNCINVGWFRVCVSDVVNVDSVCYWIFDFITDPFELLADEINDIGDISAIDRISIESLSAPNAKQANILNLDMFQMDKHYDDNPSYDWDGYIKPVPAPELTITIPNIVYVMFILYTIVIASLGWICARIYYIKHNMYVFRYPSVDVKYEDEDSTATDTDIQIYK